MKTIGLIGGMSWESTSLYYSLLNNEVKKLLGAPYSSKCLLYSVDFGEIAKLQHAGDWNALATLMIEAGQSLEKGGADFIVLCTNTMHKLADDIIKNTSIPFLHIADATAEAILSEKIKTVALLGTKFTMEEDFLINKLKKHGLSVIIPELEERNVIHRVIYEELVNGIVSDISRKKYLEIMNSLSLNGAEGFILGCTEIGMLINKENTNMKLFDTTEIHSKAAVIYSLSNLNDS